MKTLLIALLLASNVSLFSAENLSGDSKGKDKDAAKAAQLDKTAKYRVLSIGDGPVISVEKTLSIPNPKKMGQPDIKSETISINYFGGTGQDCMPAAKKFLAETLSAKKFSIEKKEQQGNSSDRIESGIKITGPSNIRIHEGNDVRFPNGEWLSDIYSTWLAKQIELKKASTAQAPAAQ